MESHYIKLCDEQHVTENTLNGVGIETQSILIAGRIGRWPMVSTICGETNDMNGGAYIAIFGLFEHNILGDETDYAVCYFDWYSGSNKWIEIDGTHDDLITALSDFGITD